jgi:hypothetical protein
VYLVAKRKNDKGPKDTDGRTIDQDMLDVCRGKATIQEIVYKIVKGDK